jgi:hypothetical protein
MTANDSQKTRYWDEKEARIRAAGVVQSVISSGAPMSEWEMRSRFGMRCVNALAASLQKKKWVKFPDAPASPPNERTTTDG